MQPSSPSRLWLYVAIGWITLWLVCAVASLANWVPDPLAVNLDARLQPPSASHWFGTDALGRDIFGRVAHGASFAFVITLLATGVALLLGTVLGLAAGWFGGWLDSLVGVLSNLFWSVPFAVFAVLLIAVFRQAGMAIVLAIGGVNWVTSARVWRTEMRRIRRSDYLRAAKAAGFSSHEIFAFHAVPALRASLWGLIGLAASESLALESGLAFLGLSLAPPAPTWGGMMAEGLSYLSTAWWWSVAPAVAVVLTLASLRTLATRLGDRIPR